MQEIRNIALIAHVDHGKTTLVDRIIYQANLVRQPENLGQLILDNNDIERERGITILAKNVSVTYKGVKINIIDTPGHSDFGGEVERVLNMADGVLLLVDAFEGCMPQTRFVLQKALELGKKPIVVVNKVDKPNCRPDEVQEEVFDLMCSLNATDEQLDFKTIFGSAKQGWMSDDWKNPTSDITPLLDAILAEIPAPKIVEGTPQLQVNSLEYSPYVGRIAVGKLTRGELKTGQQVSLCKRYDVVEKHKIKQLMVFDGLGKANVDTVQCGDICAVVGIDGFEIGDTIADSENPEALPPISIDEPTMSMLFTINNSPFFGKDGKFVTSRHIKDRLDKELEKNLALKVKPGLNADSFVVYGRGVLHLSVLIEEMRREGFELQVGQPKVLDKTINGQRCEPIEDLSIEVPEQFVGGDETYRQASYLDTQTQLFASTATRFTLLASVTPSENPGNGVFLSCFDENAKNYRGLLIRQLDNAQINIVFGQNVGVTVPGEFDREMHIAIVKDGTNYRIYADGLLVAEAESPADSYDGTLLIGAQRDADGNIFRISQTRVNHLSVYAGVMAEADIAAYDFADAPLPPELVAESAAYTMPGAFVGNGSDRALDTGVKLYDVATKDWTLDTVIDVRKGVNNGVYMSCFSEETGHYRGFMLRQDNADTLTAYVGNSVGVTVDLPQGTSLMHLVIVKSGSQYTIWQDGQLVQRVESACDNYDATLLLGAQRDADGNLFRFSNAGIRTLNITDGALSDTDAAALSAPVKDNSRF